MLRSNIATLDVPQVEASPKASPDPDPRFTKLKPEFGSEIFTKFADVKSRVQWTPERRRQFEEMWNRGDKAPAIAEVFGCKVGAINVARARFGLQPRRIVSGRPKEPDEPAHKIERVAITTSRLMEFCTKKELVAQTGHESYEWPQVIVKELVDNGIDICEETKIAPVIKVTIKTGKSKKPTRIIIEDNGPGFPPNTITDIIDYNVRVSSREAYVSPTRGRQGNALKTILPMGYVLGGKVKGETWIESRGIKHCIRFTVNQIKQEPIVRDYQSASTVTTGTRITVFWPDRHIDQDQILDLLKQFIWVNPHLTLQFTVNAKTIIRCDATNPQWTKYRSRDATSAHWYTLEQFERYASALINHEQRNATREKITVRDFIAQFRGMSSTDRQKQVLHELGVMHMSLRRFFGSETRANHDHMQSLLDLVCNHTRPVRPELLGVIGEEHLRRLSVGLGGEEKSFKYFPSFGYDGHGRPYVVEIATCAFKKWVHGKGESQGRRLITGVNFSATLENPFQSFRGLESMDEILTELRADTYAPIIVCVHYVCPHIEYLDRGKSRIGLD